MDDMMPFERALSFERETGVGLSQSARRRNTTLCPLDFFPVFLYGPLGVDMTVGHEPTDFQRLVSNWRLLPDYGQRAGV